MSATGVYPAHPFPLGIARTLSGRTEPFFVQPVPASLLYIDTDVARAHGLGTLVGDGWRPVNPLFAQRVTDHFGVQIPTGQNGQGPSPIIDYYSQRALLEPVPPKTLVRMVASRYAQREGNRGDGRSGYLVVEDAEGNLRTFFPKGIGITPCCDPAHAQAGHGDGLLPANEGLVEPVFTRVVNNLFTFPTPDAVMVLGLKRFNNTMEDRVPVEQQSQIVVRAGLHVRPAHLISQHVYLAYGSALDAGWRANPQAKHLVPRAMALQEIVGDDCVPEMDAPRPALFMEACAAAGVLQYRTDRESGDEVPDLRATLLEMLDRFARTAAEQFCWRFMHSVPSAGNAQITGGLLDLASCSANPRTAAMHTLTYTPPHGEPEYYWRLMAIRMMYDTLKLGLTRMERAQYHLGTIDFATAYRERYEQHLTRQYLLAAGLKAQVVDGLLMAQPELATRFRSLLHELATWENPGPIPEVMTRQWEVLPDAEAVVMARAVVDVFGFLGRYAEVYFRAAAAGDRPDTAAVIEALRPIYAVDDDRRMHQQETLASLAGELATVYAELMGHALREGTAYYDDAAGMRAAIMHRAAFRNAPMEDLYIWRLLPEIVAALIPTHPVTGRPIMSERDPFWRFIHRHAERSMRNVDVLLRDRGVRDWNDGRVDVGVATFGNVTYGVEVDRHANTRHVMIRIPVQDGDGPLTLSLLGEEIPLPWRRAVAEASVAYTMGRPDKRSEGTVRGTLVDTPQGSMLTFAIQTEVGAAGIFEGTLRIPGIPDQSLLEYAYVAPDISDTNRILAGRHR